jgi:hypothetical protein
MKTKSAASITMLTIGAITCALLVGCAGSGEAPTSPSENPSPSSSDSPVVSASDFTVGCDALTGLAHGFSAADAFVQTSGVSVVSPGSEAIRRARGIACEWAGDGRVVISALADATDDYRAAREAADAQAMSDWAPHSDNAAGEEAITTCYDHGTGLSTCMWSILDSGNWIVVEARGLPLDLVQRPDLPSGWAQQPLPDPQGTTQAAVVAIVEAIVSAAEPASTAEANPSAGCQTVMDAARAEAALGLPAGSISVSLARTGVQMSAHVASTAGYALPYFAADRAGWTRCTAVASGWQIDVTAAPGAAPYFDPERTIGADGVTHAVGEGGDIYQLAEFDGDEVRAVVVISADGALEGDPDEVLAAILG